MAAEEPMTPQNVALWLSIFGGFGIGFVQFGAAHERLERLTSDNASLHVELSNMKADADRTTAKLGDKMQALEIQLVGIGSDVKVIRVLLDKKSAPGR